MDEAHNEAIVLLKSALAEQDSGGDLQTLVVGHGFQSRFLSFEWNGPTLGIEIRLPVGRVLSNATEQAEDAAVAGAACRLALLLLLTEASGRLLADGEAHVSFIFDESGARYSTQDADGVELDAGEGVASLLVRLGAAFPEPASALDIIWP